MSFQACGGDAGVGHDDVRASQCGDPFVDGLPESLEVPSVNDGGEDSAVRFLNEPNRFGEVLLGRRRVGNAGRKLAGDVDGDDVGALAGHANGVRPALATRRPR